MLEKGVLRRVQLVNHVFPFVAFARGLPNDVGLIVDFIDDIEHEHLFLRFGECLPFLPVALHRF